jgi:5-methylcytosine-specific restriction endonuclease McrA
MLSLKFSDIKALNFFNKIKSKISNASSINLSNEDLKKLIISKPQELIVLNNNLMENHICGFNWEEYLEYTKFKTEQKKQNEKYYNKIIEIQNVFNYDKIIGRNYFLAELLDVHTCTYCNRNYVKTIGSTNDKTIRAEYDHFFSQSKYPLLALSFYNLIPICGNCNKKKLNKNFTLKTHLHPYTISDEEKKFTFTFRKKNFIENNVNIKISTNDKTSIEKIEKTFLDLQLEKIYNAHSDKELKDLLDLRYKYSKNYLDILLNKTFPNLSMSKEEAYRLIFGIEIKEEDFHKRPFSKFKKDIIAELLRVK